MKVIDAFWEERNLGLRVCEIIINKDDVVDFDTLSDLEKSYGYLVAKVPGDSVHLVHQLESHGFRYLENQLILYVLTSELLNIENFLDPRFLNISCEKVSSNKDLNNICNQIKKGLYAIGRISADPDIKAGTSDLRIVNWLKDLWGKGNVLIYRLVRNETSLGYFVLEKINKSQINVVQAGIFAEYQNKGFSCLIPYYVLKIAFEDKIKGVFASVSSNNLKMINSISKFVHLSVRRTYLVMRKKTTGETTLQSNPV